jgi:hypothetical protein
MSVADDSRLDAWIHQVTDALSELVGQDEAQARAARWRERAATNELSVMVFGPYDSGKTTLVKRLLTEAGVPVPEWLTVSGAPETTESRTVGCGDLAFIDTPGTSSGDTTSDDEASGMLPLADVLLITMTTKLFSDADGEGDRILEAARGHRDAVRFVVTQTDRTSVDPTDRPVDHRALMDTKKAELSRLLASAGIPVELSSLHAVSADPFGSVGSRTSPTPADYSKGAGWDGIEALRADLATLPAHHATLRRATALRFWQAVGTGAVTAADRRASELESALAEARQTARDTARHVAALDTLDQAARTELQSDIKAELLSAAGRERDSSIEDVVPVVQNRLESRLALWMQIWTDRLRQVAENAAHTAPDRLARPTVNLRAYLEGVIASGSPGTSGHQKPLWTLAPLIPRAEKEAEKVVGAIFRHKHEMSIDLARVELEKLDSLSFQKQAEYFKAGGRIADKEAKDSIKKSLGRAGLLTDVAPIVLEMGAFAATDALSRRSARREQQRREELHTKVEQTAGTLTERILAGELVGGVGWSDAVVSVRKGLAVGQPDAQTVASMTAELVSVNGGRQHLRDVLNLPPHAE